MIAFALLSAQKAVAQQTEHPIVLRVSVPLHHITRHAPAWRAGEVALAAGFTAALSLDAAQTRSLARGGWRGWRETNPLLGPRPTVGRIDTYSALAAVTTLGVAAALPPRQRRWWLVAVMATEAYVVLRTAHAGVSLQLH